MAGVKAQEFRASTGNSLTLKAMLSSAIAKLQSLRGSPSHHIAGPASLEAIAAARERFGAAFTEELATLYRHIDGFALNVRGQHDVDVRCCSLEHLGTPRCWVDEWDYALNGDPDRLLVFDVPNGSYLSFTRLGIERGAWIDDFREGVQGVVAKNLGALLTKMLDQLERDDGRIFIFGCAPLPAGYKRALANLHDQAIAAAQAKWEAERASDPDAAKEADDWSDV